MSKLRVFVVAPGTGGISQMVAYFIREMSKDPSFEISLLDSYGRAGKFGMPFHFLCSCVLLAFACILRRVDLVHIHMASRTSLFRKMIFCCIARTFHVPTLLHHHSGKLVDAFLAMPHVLQSIVRHITQRSIAVVTLGQYFRDFFVNTVCCEPARVLVLPNGVPGPAQLPQRCAGTTRKLLFLGDLCENKGVSTLLIALSDARLKTFDWQINIAGPGPVDYYQRISVTYGLCDKVKFLGRVGELKIQELLAESEILLCPSRREGLPLVILEAMSYGLAIIATPVGAIPDAVSNRWNGLLVPVDTPSALAAALLELLESNQLREELMRNSRDCYLQKFQISFFVEALAAMYRRYGSSK